MRTILILVLWATTATSAIAEPAADSECYDAIVTGHLIGQTPTPAGDCGEGCLIVSWPWILDVNVTHVSAGRSPRGLITALDVQHTYRIAKHAERWYLRRNTLGVFNVVQSHNASGLCPRDIPPAKPFITPGAHETLEDLRRAGEARYGKQP